jgi:thiamine-monophosphate kinase
MVLRGRLDRLGAAARDHLIGRYRLPLPRLELGRRLVGLASSALDVSDGLLGDAQHLARRSGLAITLDWPSVPLSAAAGEAVAGEPDLASRIVSGGDDYELLFTVTPERWEAVERAAAEARVAVTVIGRCRAGAGVAIDDGEGRDMTPSEAGWRHGTSP